MGSTQANQSEPLTVFVSCSAFVEPKVQTDSRNSEVKKKLFINIQNKILMWQQKLT